MCIIWCIVASRAVALELRQRFSGSCWASAFRSIRACRRLLCFGIHAAKNFHCLAYDPSFRFIEWLLIHLNYYNPTVGK
jgi:hypothetical protein